MRPCLIHSRSKDGKVQPLLASYIAIEDLADMDAALFADMLSLPNDGRYSRWTRQLPPAARKSLHKLSAVWRSSTATRTRYQWALIPTFELTMSGCLEPKTAA